MPDIANIVTVDEGAGPVKAIRDAAGRLITADQMQTIRDKQQADLDKISAIKDQLMTGDAATTDQVVGQMRDELNRRIALLDRQRSELVHTLDQLQAGDAFTTQKLVGQMIQRLDRRVALTTASRDRSDALLAQLQPAETPVKAEPITGTPA